jgi:hypothetical protein
MPEERVHRMTEPQGVSTEFSENRKGLDSMDIPAPIATPGPSGPSSPDVSAPPASQGSANSQASPPPDFDG